MSTITSKFAEYQSDIARVFTGSEFDAMQLVCRALEHYARDVGLGDHRVKTGITGLQALILGAACRPGFGTKWELAHEIATRYGVEVIR
jgi:hypothetical protein